MGPDLVQHKYFDNILFFLQRSGGGSVYWGELMKRFSAHSPATSHFIQPQVAANNLVLPTLSLSHVVYEKYLPVKVMRYLPLTLRLPEGALFHSSYYRYSAQKSVSNFVTVHDFIYEYYRAGLARFIHTKQKAASIYKAKGIVCISESTRKDLLKFYPKLTSKNIRVIYNGVSDDFFMRSEEELKQWKHYETVSQHRYVLFIGHRTSYKNFDFAVEVVQSLPETFRMVIVGNPLEGMEQQLLETKLKGRYLFAGNIENAQLNNFYNLAHCLIYPSSYEGFGIPIIEAYRSGCPVVAQNVSAIPEVAKDCALLADGLDKQAFKNNIVSLVNSNLRRELRDAAYNRSLQFSWDKCFNELNEFYEYSKKD